MRSIVVSRSCLFFYTAHDREYFFLVHGSTEDTGMPIGIREGYRKKLSLQKKKSILITMVRSLHYHYTPRFLRTQQLCCHGNTVPEERGWCCSFMWCPFQFAWDPCCSLHVIRLFNVNLFIDLSSNTEPILTSTGEHICRLGSHHFTYGLNNTAQLGPSDIM